MLHVCSKHILAVRAKLLAHLHVVQIILGNLGVPVSGPGYHHRLITAAVNRQS